MREHFGHKKDTVRHQNLDERFTNLIVAFLNSQSRYMMKHYKIELSERHMLSLETNTISVMIKT